MTRSLISGLVLLVFSADLAAQSDSNTSCQLLVQVLTGEERRIETPIQVELLAPQGPIATLNMVDGSAQFQIACGKTYRLALSGIGIEDVTTTYFTINAMESSHTETVHVKSQNQLNHDKSAVSTPGSPSVSVSELMIPDKAGAEMKKGLDAYSKGDMEKAEAHFEKAAAEYPRYARAYDMLGAIATRRPDRVKARELFSKSIQVDDTYAPAYVDLARMEVQDRQYAESETLLAKAIAMNPTMPDAVALLAVTEFANKEYDKALADVNRTHALRDHEHFAEVHLMAGEVLRMQNQPDAAIAQFQLFLKEKPDSPDAAKARQALASLRAGRQP